MPLVAPLQLKGCTRIPSLRTTTTPSGASKPRALSCSGLPLRPRGRTGVFRRREGPSSLPVPGHPLLARLAVLWFLIRGDTSCRGSPPADPLFGWVRSPFFIGYFFFVQLVYPRGAWVLGQTDVLSRLRSSSSLAIAVWYVLVLDYMFHRVARYPGGRTFFPAVLTYTIVVSCAKVNGFFAHLAVDLNSVFTSLSQGVVRVVSKVVAHFWGAGFPAGSSIDEIDDLHHADRTTPSDLHFVSKIKKGEGQAQGYLRSLELFSSWVSRGNSQCKSSKAPAVGRLARWRLMKQPQDHPLWSTRQPRWRLMRRRCARGFGRTVRDSFCTGAQEVGPSGWCGGCGLVHPLGLGGH